jgi:uncharacterized protein (TIGR02588 family)
MSDKKSPPSKRPTRADRARALVEWTTFGISVGILLLLVSLLTYDYLTYQERPVELEVSPELEDVTQRGTGFYLPVELTNRGHKAAEAILLTISLRVDGQIVEQSTIQFGLLAGLGRRRGAAIFNHDPRLGELEFDVGYLVP